MSAAVKNGVKPNIGLPERFHHQIPKEDWQPARDINRRNNSSLAVNGRLSHCNVQEEFI